MTTFNDKDAPNRNNSLAISTTSTVRGGGNTACHEVPIGLGADSRPDVQNLYHAKRTPEIEEISNEGNEKRGIVRDDSGKESVHAVSFPNELTPLKLARIAESKSIEQLEAFGGTEGLVRSLGSDAKRGLSGTAAPFEEWRRLYGPNVLPTRKSKSLLLLMWIVLQQKILVLLSLAAIVALALGLYQDFGAPRETYICGQGETCTEPPVDWVKGVGIMLAVAIVVVFSSLNDWQKERQYKELNAQKDDRTVKVMRDGNETVINVKDLVVGDVAILDPGEVAPCDGIFLSGYNVRCDESSITGESDAIKKIPHPEYHLAKEGGRLHAHTDCFIISGSKVLEGVGTYIIIAVGELSCNGRIMMALRSDTENTPLQSKLKKLGDLIARLATAISLFLFAVLMIRFFIEIGTNSPSRTSFEKGLAFIDILVICVSVFVVAIPEGLPLAVTIALSLATKRMTAEKLLVRLLAGCETMANASAICTDKTGTLTQNSMTVVAGTIGIRAKFVRHLSENASRANVGEEPGLTESEDQREHRQNHPEDFAVDQSDLDSIMSPALKRTLNEAICVNSTAFEDVDQSTEERIFVGSKTETALLKFVQELGCQGYQSIRERANVVQMIPFSSERKSMGVVVEAGQGHWRLYLKGASEILTRKCVRHVVVSRPGETTMSDEVDGVETKVIDASSRDHISRTITFYANQAFRTIALCYRDLDSWPPKHLDIKDADQVAYEDLATDLTLIGIAGIEDPLREGVTEAVAACRRAGVQVKMCTGDNVLTARSIALQCGIYTPGGVVMEGPVFRELDDRELLEVVPRLQVLARSSPEDKKILVEKLKELGEIVAVTGDGTNDGPALKTAHIGFSMGLTGTEVAKEASDIILMDDNFANIVKAIMWGRCVNDALRKFLQFQISANVTSVFITFVSSVANSQDDSALSAVQLLWVNIIVNTFAALAFATDPASPAVLDRKPDKASASLFTVDMFKQIFGQASYQAFITLLLHFAGDGFFDFSWDPNNPAVEVENERKLDTLIFNSFVFAQIFNAFNCRIIGNKKNIFRGIHRNPWFICIIFLELACQVVIVFVGGQAFSMTDISGKFWGISLALGVVSIPLGFLLRCIPNEPIERFLLKVGLVREPSVLPVERPNAKSSTVSRFSKVLGKIPFWPRRGSNSVSFSRSTTLVGGGVDASSINPTMISKRESIALPQRPGMDPVHSRLDRPEGSLHLQFDNEHTGNRLSTNLTRGDDVEANG